MGIAQDRAAPVPRQAQPKVPLWGYEDESKPKVMAEKIAAAADHGIDVFIFDWYHYDDGPFLDRPLDRGFLKAKNIGRLKFALMWANHDWLDIMPARRGVKPPLLYPGTVTPETFEKIGDLVIKNYFLHSSYWRIDGRPYFSFYELTKLLDGFGSVAATRAALDRFRAKAVAAGLPGLHLNAVVWGQPILPGERTPVDAAKLVKELGFDSVTSYVWIHHVVIAGTGDRLQPGARRLLQVLERGGAEVRCAVLSQRNDGLGFEPALPSGDEFGNFGYPFMNTMSGNTPERFQEALALTKQRLLADPQGPRILNINAWNEWTEGSYLEPDTVHGMKYLEAVREVVGATKTTKPADTQSDLSPETEERDEPERAQSVACESQACSAWFSEVVSRLSHDGRTSEHLAPRWKCGASSSLWPTPARLPKR
jgi:hypothetical protein